jgi:hypothetical protein
MLLLSASHFPGAPQPEARQATAQECRAVLVSAHRCRELEDTGDAMPELIDESERQSGFWLVEMVRPLVQQANRWRSLNASSATLTAVAAREAGAAGELGGNR